tara:strand:+ start:274 stop:477 length:204 start_codon:yes stop_codon:yes gene_type:complete
MLSRPLLTIHEAAALLKSSEPTVRGLIKDEGLRAIKLGREYRIAVKDLEAFLNDHATRAAADHDDND